ncbi:MAG: glucosamine-6-phosphate deaminase [Bacteroidetes bacterium]|nr:glucosamine-6-phosphate deaminase [Bacteroidota bacterium]
MIQQFKASLLEVQVYQTRAEMGSAAAELLKDKINELLTTQPYLNIIFAAAPSQNEFLAALIKLEIDWSRINAFHMDEYVGLDAAASQGFGNFLKQRLFNLVPFHSVHLINGNAADILEECARYENLLLEYAPDIVCMGIGENGHLAFNDPPVADFNDPVGVKMVELEAPCRQQQVNDGCFETIEQVPTHALTLTIPTLLKGRFIFCVVPGATKAVAVFNTLKQHISEEFPSTILRTHSNAILFLDVQSALNIGNLNTFNIA